MTKQLRTLIFIITALVAYFIISFEIGLRREVDNSGRVGVGGETLIKEY